MASNDEESDDEREVGVDEEGNEIKKPKAKKEKKRWVKKKRFIFNSPFHVFSFALQFNPTCVRGNFGLKLQNSSKLLHARLYYIYCDVKEKS